MTERLVIVEDPAAGAAIAADRIARTLTDAVAARGRADWATTGGSTPVAIYRRLSAPPLDDDVPWADVHVWWGDDRFVPSDHPLSNALPLNQILLASGGDEETGSPEGADVGGQGDGVRIPAAQLHEVPVTEAIARSGGAAWAAVRYAAEIERAGPAAGPNGDPVFDVLIMGVGPDGHVLSIFPGSAVWDASANAVAVPAPTHVEPHVDRVTLHPRLIAAARRVVLITTGAGKADLLARAWGGADVRELPVGAARLPQAVWLLDEAAASRLPRP